MKGLILCGGDGTRLRPHSHSRPKHLLTVGNKPVIHYMIVKMVAASIRDIGIVIPARFQHQFVSSLGDQYIGASITYIVQEQARGLADAVHVAKTFIDEQPFLLCLGDNFITDELTPFLKRFDDENLDGLLLVSQVADPTRYGVVQFQGTRVVKLVEKPQDPPSHFAIIGVYAFKSNIFDAIAKLQPSSRGEYELTDAIQSIIESGGLVSFEITRHWWVDTGTPADLLACNRWILSEQGKAEYGNSIQITSSQITGPVIIEDGALITDSLIRGPAIIGREAKIIRSNIGPYTSIGQEGNLQDSTIEDSVILERAYLSRVHFQQSVIGGNVKVERATDTVTRLCIGDDSQISL